MGKLNKVIDLIVFYFTSTALILLVLICFAQVVARYVVGASYSWAEEVSICLMLWATWAGACYAIKQGSHLYIPLLPDKLSPKGKLILQSVMGVFIIAFLCIIIFTSRTIIDGLTNATFISLPNVPLNIMYYSVPVGCTFMIYYIIRMAVTDWKILHDQGKREV
jgi:TRAP-type C4-dicarboxylate transport system permease small subunit